MCSYRNPYSRSKAPLSCPYFSVFSILSVSSLFFNIFIFSFFSSCVIEPLQPLSTTDKANNNVPTNKLNRLDLLKLSCDPPSTLQTVYYVGRSIRPKYLH